MSSESRSPGPKDMTGTPQLVLAAFLDAFSQLDLDAMRDCFATEATAFFPAEHEQTRLEGREAICRAFSAVVARIRAGGATTIHLDTRDVLVQEWADAAVVTFHLRGEHLSRRTLVLERRAGTWQIVHMHASNAAIDG
jgi:ketosteroid isomerase-like protein